MKPFLLLCGLIASGSIRDGVFHATCSSKDDEGEFSLSRLKKP